MRDGGSAFPLQASHAVCIPSEGCRVAPGMSLRDYFAGQALAGLVSLRSVSLDDAAVLSFVVADKMLSERGERREQR